MLSKSIFENTLCLTGLYRKNMQVYNFYPCNLFTCKTWLFKQKSWDFNITLHKTLHMLKNYLAIF